MMKKNFSTLTASSVLLSSMLFSAQAFAIGTNAGTAINNTATVSFTRGGSTDSEEASISFKVDEVINVNVTATNASSNITNGDSGVALTYTVTNTGNGTELFQLLESINSGNNSLPLSASDLTVYYNTSPTPAAFDPNDASNQAYTGAGISIKNDEFITVYIVTDVPNAAALDDKSELLLTAVSQTEAGGIKASESAFGTVIQNAGDDATNAIIAVDQGRDNAGSELVVTTFDPSKALDVSISKLILGSNALVNNSATTTEQKIPGAMVTYFIKVTVKNDTATALNISDLIPANMTYVAQSLRKQSAVGSTINTPTYIKPALATKTPATYSNFSALTDSNSDGDGAETRPNSGTVTSINVAFGDLAPGEYAILLDAEINN